MPAMKNKKNHNSKDQRRLRRIAVQIAGQLPEDLKEALTILAYATEIAKYVQNGQPAS